MIAARAVNSQDMPQVKGRMCSASFEEFTADTEGLGLRVMGLCPDCGQRVGGIVVRPGIGRVNWHEVV